MTTVADSAEPCYLAYGVGKKSALEKQNGSLSSLEHDDISLYYSPVSASEFGADRLNDNLQDMEWLETKVVEFQTQMEALSSKSSILPFSFGTVYESITSMQEYLQTHRDSLTERLAFFADKSEWGVKVFLSTPLFRNWLVVGDGEGDASAEENSPGAAFFERKKKEYTAIEKEEQELQSVLSRIRQDLEKLSESCKEIDFLEEFGEETDSMKPVYNLTMLMNEEQTSALKEKTQSLTDQYTERGIVLRLSGPWPPYNFMKQEE